MKTKIILGLAFLGLSWAFSAQAETEKPWKNGKLEVSENGRYLKNGDKPFFWMGNTSWLMPERLNRDEVEYFLDTERKNGYNVEQIQVVNSIPTYNVFGQSSFPDGFNFKNINRQGVYGYWDHLDYIIHTAENNGIYIGMVCIWGSNISGQRINVKQAEAYAAFLANRYKDVPNIIWIMGGDIPGNIHPEIYEAMAKTIRSIDKNHLMTFHPRGRTTSAKWFNDAEWLDFNMFQSGHRRYGQRNGDGDYTIQDNTEEDNWRYVDLSYSLKPVKPVLDGEPSYENIPQGLHDVTQPLWKDNDVRRYAYWSVFAGSCGHTYGHNAIMQMMRPGLLASYGCNEAWYDALKDPGYLQMKYLKQLMLMFPYFERVPDQSIISGQNGERYDRAIATRGNDYLLVYNYSGRPMDIDLTKISGAKKNVWWFNPSDGKMTYLGEYDNKVTNFVTDNAYMSASCDRVLIAVDADKNYINKNK
jgi:hypothetical protein